METTLPSSSPLSPARKGSAAFFVTFFTALAVTFLAQDAAQGGVLAQRISALCRTEPPDGETVSSAEQQVVEGQNDDDDDDAMETLRQKLQPKKLLLNEKGELSPHQFLHLHHMKTGGSYY